MTSKIFIILVFTLGFFGSSISQKLPTASLTFTTSNTLHTFDSTFVSVNIDTASLDAHMDLTDPTLINIIKQLGSVWLRIGGTSQNTLVYSPNGPAGDEHGDCHINDAYWADVSKLQAATGAKFLFGLNRQVKNNKYDPTINATALWKTTAAGRYKIDAWSVGNELIGGSFDSKQYAEDYVTLADALKAYPSVGQELFGPSAAGFPGTAALTPFMSGTKSLLTGFTFHAYCFGTCSLDVYTQKSGLEHMNSYFTNYVNLRDSVAPGLPLILEECATQAGGGCEGLSDRFVSGFWWIHTLGMAAEAGIIRVHRQDVAGFSFNHRGSHYMLAGTSGWINETVSGPLTPHPDWFTSVLHKQLAGNAVLTSHLTAEAGIDASVAVHVWCAAKGANAPAGAVTISFLNLNESDVQLVLSGTAATPRVEYMLQPGSSTSETFWMREKKSFIKAVPPSSLTSDKVLLNGKELTVGKDGMLPNYPIPGKRVTDQSDIVLPAWSYGFIVLETPASACLSVK